LSNWGGGRSVLWSFEGLGAADIRCNDLVRVEQRESERLRGKT
jgi:hypothetical protein